jgi:hypothetical protein
MATGVYVKPEDRIIAYLFAHKSRVEYSTIDVVVKDVKLSVFYGMSPLSDDEVSKIVSRWASVHAIGLLLPGTGDGPDGSPAPGAPAPRSDSEFIAAATKALTTITDGVKVGKKNANINIGVTGATANLKRADSSVALGLSWTGTLKLDAASGPFHFSGRLSKDKWEITLSFPQDTYIPDLSSLGKVFREGENAIGQMAEATRSFSDINDASKVGALIKPHADALKGAVEAFSGIAKASKKGGASFGFKLTSPEPGPGEQGIPGGVQGSIVFTYVF